MEKKIESKARFYSHISDQIERRFHFTINGITVTTPLLRIAELDQPQGVVTVHTPIIFEDPNF